MSTEVVPVTGQATKVANKVLVSAAYGSAGSAFADTTDSTSVEVINDGMVGPIEYQVGSNDWVALLPFQSKQLEISLAATGLKLRRGYNANGGSATVNVTSKASSLSAGDDPAPALTVDGFPYVQARPTVDLKKAYGLSPSNTGAVNSALVAQGIAYAQGYGRPLYLPGQTAGWQYGAYPISQDVDLSLGSVTLIGDRGFSGFKQTVAAEHIFTIGGFNLALLGVNGFHDTGLPVNTSMGHGLNVQGTTQGARLQDLFLWRNNKGFYGADGQAFFSSVVDNCAFKWLASSAIDQGEGTGNVWTNTYCSNDEFGVGTAVADYPVKIGDIEAVFNQLNIEGFTYAMMLSATGSILKINGLHIERAKLNGFGGGYIRAVDSQVLIDNLWVGYSDHGYTGAGSTGALVFTNFSSRVNIDGFEQPLAGGANVNTVARPFQAVAQGGTGISSVSINRADLTGLVTEPTAADAAQIININDQVYGCQNPAYAASLAIDFSLAVGNQDVLVGTLTGAITLAAPTNVPKRGKEVCIYLVQDGTGSRTPTWNAAYKGATLTSSGTANQKAIVKFRSDGTNLVQVFSTGWYS